MEFLDIVDIQEVACLAIQVILGTQHLVSLVTLDGQVILVIPVHQDCQAIQDILEVEYVRTPYPCECDCISHC